MLLLNKVKFHKRKQQFFYNAALKWNAISKFLVEPYEIKLINSNNTDKIENNIDITINYDFTLSVCVLKTKLKKIIMAIQCDGIENQ